MSSPNEIYWSTIYNYFASNAAAPDYTAYPLSSPESRNGCTSNPSTAFSPSFQSEVAAVPQEDGLGLYPSPQALYPSPQGAGLALYPPPQEVEAALYSPLQGAGLALYSPYAPYSPNFPEKWEGEEQGEETEEECTCGFDFCDGFCKGLVDDVDVDAVSPEEAPVIPDIAKAGIIPDDLQPYNTYDGYNTQLDSTGLANLQLYNDYNAQLEDGTQFHDASYPSYPSYSSYEGYNDLLLTHPYFSSLSHVHDQQEEQAALKAWVSLYLNSPEPQKSVDTIPCESGWERRVWGAVTKKLRDMREGRGRGKWERGEGV